MKLELDINEVNGILATLGKLPYEQSFRLIEKIQSQAQGQLEEAETPLEVEEVELKKVANDS